MAHMAKSALIGEYRQLDGWHAARVFDSIVEGRAWCSRVDETGGHEHARRVRRVRVGSAAWSAAIELELAGDELGAS